MAELFPSARPADVQVANDGAQPVEAKTVGEDAQQSATRTYSAEDVEKIVKDRLTRERKKFEKSLSKPQGEDTDEEPNAKAQQVTPNVAEDLKAKLTEERKRSRELAEKVNKYRGDSLKAQVERKLNEFQCLDPEVVLDHMLNRKLVHLDDDGELIVENATGNLDDLVRDYLAKKPHLVRATATAGVGTRGPAPAISTNPKSITELEQALGITRNDKTKLFGRS